MKKIIAFLLLVSAFNCYGQSKNDKINGKITDSQLIEALKDTTIAVEYINKSQSDSVPKPAYFVNGQFLFDSEAIQPDLIESLNIQRRDTVIADTRYSGMVFIELKNHSSKDYNIPKMIALNDLKNDYTTLKSQPVLFTIDGKFINANYDFYKIDKNKILKIVVEKFAGSGGNSEIWLVKLLTRTKENIQRSKQIRIRGVSELAKK